LIGFDFLLQFGVFVPIGAAEVLPQVVARDVDRRLWADQLLRKLPLGIGQGSQGLGIAAAAQPCFIGLDKQPPPQPWQVHPLAGRLG